MNLSLLPPEPCCAELKKSINRGQPPRKLGLKKVQCLSAQDVYVNDPRAKDPGDFLLRYYEGDAIGKRT